MLLATSYSYAFFVLSNLLACIHNSIYARYKHEQILKLLVHNVHEKALQRVKTDEILKTCACYL